MTTADNNADEIRKMTIGSIIIIVAIIIILLVASWVFSRGVADDDNNLPAVPKQSTGSSPNLPSEAGNPNGTGGTNAGGTGTSNDPSISTPSPAGGVDTNGVPAGGNSSP